MKVSLTDAAAYFVSRGVMVTDRGRLPHAAHAGVADRVELHTRDMTDLQFPDASFDLVVSNLAIHNLPGNAARLAAIDEAVRVLRPGGIVAVGHTKSPESGVDAQLKRQLAVILEGMQVPWHQPREWRRQALAWLEDVSVRHWYRETARWNVTTNAEEFLSRHRTGAKFAALPPAVQQESLVKLRAWAETNFGSVNAGFEEHHSFALSIFEF